MTRTSSLPALARLGIGLSALAVGLSACSSDSGPGDEAQLVEALTRGDSFSQGEAECIANAVFTEYGADEDALKLITRTTDYETLTGEGDSAVEGFGDFFDGAVSACTGGN